MSTYQRYIGVDYSVAGRPDRGQKGIRVFISKFGAKPAQQAAGDGGRWSRQALAAVLRDALKEPARTLVGIDHAFSLPAAYLDRCRLPSWDAFLEHAQSKWATRRKPVREVVEWDAFSAYKGRNALRLTEQFSSSAKSVFNHVGPGVAFSTFAGIPWLAELRREFRGGVHFWPFDGWDVPLGKSVVTEVYPSLFRNRYEREPDMGADEHDAYAVCPWMLEADRDGFLPFYLNPPLTSECRIIGEQKEGWILGVA